MLLLSSAIGIILLNITDWSVQEERTQSKFSTKIGCDIPDDDVVVSIMLPAQQPEKGAGNKSLTTLDEIFVVVVKPMKKYVTYACSLQDSILV